MLSECPSTLRLKNPIHNAKRQDSLQAWSARKIFDAFYDSLDKTARENVTTKTFMQARQVLKDNGIIVIGHATRGGNMHYPSINFSKLTQNAKRIDLMTSGPYMYFLYKHLRIRSDNFYYMKACSHLARLLQALFQSRWIEYYLLKKG